MEHFDFLVFSYFIFTLVLSCYSTLTTVDTTQGKKIIQYCVLYGCIASVGTERFAIYNNYNDSGSFNVTLVCSGKQLILECRSSLQEDFVLEWDVYIPYHNKSYSKLYSKMGLRDTEQEEIESMVTLVFDRTSESGHLPLVSQLLISNISVNLNRTMVNCTERSQDNNNIIMQTIIHVINSDFGK